MLVEHRTKPITCRNRRLTRTCDAGNLPYWSGLQEQSWQLSWVIYCRYKSMSTFINSRALTLRYSSWSIDLIATCAKLQYIVISTSNTLGTELDEIKSWITGGRVYFLPNILKLQHADNDSDLLNHCRQHYSVPGKQRSHEARIGESSARANQEFRHKESPEGPCRWSRQRNPGPTPEQNWLAESKCPVEWKREQTRAGESRDCLPQHCGYSIVSTREQKK